MIEIELIDADNLVVKLRNVEDLRFVRLALRAGALHIKGKIDDYPPSTQANQPGQRRWYERGYGPKWMRSDGSIGGRKTSQTLERRWGIAPEQNGGLTQIISNNATYAPFVQDRDKQAWFHTINGWPTAQGVLESEAPVVMELLREYFDKEFGE